jgi:hypothetical protein
MATAKQLLGHVWDRVTNHREEAKGSKPLHVELAFCSQSLLNSSYCVLLLTLPEALHSSREASNLRYPSFQNPRNTSANHLILQNCEAPRGPVRHFPSSCAHFPTSPAENFFHQHTEKQTEKTKQCRYLRVKEAV